MFNTCGGVLREGIPMRYRAIQEHDRRYPIWLMYRGLLRLGRSAGERPVGAQPRPALGHPGGPPGVP